MAELKFLTVSDVIAIHDVVMVASNQSPASLVRPDALESAVHSARNLAWYNGADAPAVAAQLAIQISLAHPWVDGNKRTAATTGVLFSRYNGARVPSPEEALDFGQRLIDYIEAEHNHRDAVFADFARFVETWFP